MMTNREAMNEVAAFCRDKNGMLAFSGLYPTNGKGTGPREVSDATPNDGIDPLASQGSLSLSRDGRFLFAVNAGSNSISSFIITDSGAPLLVDVKPSCGVQPSCLDAHGNLLYVSNVGGTVGNYSSNIAGFGIDGNGRLAPIPGSAHYLSTINAQPASIVFTPDDSKIVVSELTTNRLSVFKVNMNGTVTGPVINDSNGMRAFGSRFLSSGVLLVTEDLTMALSSYSVGDNGVLRVISGSVPTGQKATCWVAASRDERFAYTTNTLAGTISTYRIDGSGALTVVGHTTSTPEGAATGLPTDVGVSRDGRSLYTLNGNLGTVSAFAIKDDGCLVRLHVAAWTCCPYFGSMGLAVL